MSVRTELELLTVEGLRKVAGRQGVDIRGTKPTLLVRLTDHFERIGWPEKIIITSSEDGNQNMMRSESLLNIAQASTANRNEGREIAIEHEEIERNISTPNVIPGGVNIQQIVNAVVQVLQSQQVSRVNTEMISGSSTQAPRTRNADSGQNLTNNWNQVKFTAKLIPVFSGKEDENIITWLDRIVNVAQMYGISEEVLVLAAINQLKGRALEWYNRQPLGLVATWGEFRYQIRKYFERKVSYTMTLARVSARTWKVHMEKFIDYAEDKLRLMQFLTLTEREQIELLADGVKEPSLRRLVLNSGAETVPDFIEQVRITEDNIEAS